MVYDSGKFKITLKKVIRRTMDKLIKHSRQSVQQLTEDKIKESPLSWAWQFAKELED